MTRFGPVLRRVEEGLDLPEPTRSRVVREMASDLEDLFAAYRERGLDEDEAERRALVLLGASSAAMDELRSVHESPALRLLRRFARPEEGRLGPGLATVLSLAVVAAGGATLLGADALRSSNPWTWIVAATGGLGAATAVWKAVALHLHPRALRRPVEREARPVFYLSAACAVVGLGAGLLVLQGAPVPAGETAAAFWGTVREAAVTASLGLLLALVLGLAGAHLHRRALAVARAMEGVRGFGRWPGRSGPAPEMDHHPREGDR